MALHPLDSGMASPVDAFPLMERLFSRTLPSAVKEESYAVFPNSRTVFRALHTVRCCRKLRVEALLWVAVLLSSVAGSSCAAGAASSQEESQAFHKNSGCLVVHEDEDVRDAGVTVTEVQDVSYDVALYSLSLPCLRPYLARNFFVESRLQEVARSLNRQIEDKKRWRMELALPYDVQEGFGSIVFAESSFLDAYDQFKLDTGRSRPLFRCTRVDLTKFYKFQQLIFRLLTVGISLASPFENLYAEKEKQDVRELNKALVDHASFEANVSIGSVSDRSNELLQAIEAARDRRKTFWFF